MQDYIKNELCDEIGHDYKPFAEWGRVKMIDGVEKCRRCGWKIVDRERASRIQKDRHKLSISTVLRCEHFAKKINQYVRVAPEIFPNVTDSRRVANVIYYLRYRHNWTPRRIEDKFGFMPGTLNRYVYMHPAVVRGNAIVALES